MYQTAGMVKFVWGIPALYLQYYLKSFGNNRKATAKMNTMIQEMSGGDQQTTKMLSEYFSLFHTSWLADRFHIRWIIHPRLWAERAARSAIANLTSNPEMPSAESQMMLAIANTFNITTFMNEQMEREFAVSYIATSANITDTHFLNEIYDLGNLANKSSEDSNATVQNFVSTVVIPNGTINTYPIQLPADLRSSFVSPDGHVTIISLAFTKGAEWTDSNNTKPAVENVKKIREKISQLKETEHIQGLETSVSGDAPISLDLQESMSSDFSLIEFVTIPVLIILMGLFFRSVVTPVLPIGAVMVALGLSQAVVLFYRYCCGSRGFRYYDDALFNSYGCRYRLFYFHHSQIPRGTYQRCIERRSSEDFSDLGW